MVLPTMTWEEIYNEVATDWDEVLRKVTSKLRVIGAGMMRKKQRKIVEVFHVKTTRYNEWSAAIAITPASKVTNFYMKSFDKIGVVAFGVTLIENVPFVVKYNTHFLKRYKERMNLDLVRPEQVMKSFFKNNSPATPMISELEVDGTNIIYIAYENGMGIGLCNPEKKLIHLKTFISTELFHEKQKELVEFMKAEEKAATGVQVVIKPEHFKDIF